MANKEKTVEYVVCIQQARDEFAEYMDPTIHDSWTRPDENEKELGPFATLTMAVDARSKDLLGLGSELLPYEGHIFSVGPRGGRKIIFV